MTITEAMEEYLYYIRAIDQKALSTIASYQKDLMEYAGYLKEQKITTIEAITTQDIQQYVIYLETKRLFKRSSVNHMLTSIHMFHRFLSMMNPSLVDVSVHVRGGKTQQHLPLYFQLADITKLLDSFGNDDQSLYEKAILELLYGCGLRVSEVCGLKLSQVHMDQAMLRVIGKGDKERMVPMHARCVKALSDYLEIVRVHWEKKRSPFVFINRLNHPLTRQYVHTLIKAKLKEQGLDERLSAHSFRHSFASHLLDGGADLRVVQELLGHRDITMTQIYTHVQNRRLQEAYQNFHPRSKKRKG